MPPVDSTTQEQRTDYKPGGVTGKGFLPGQSGNPAGRPKGSLSIKDEVRKYLEDNPEYRKEMVRKFVHSKPELVWQMLEGKPGQKIEASGPNDTPLIPESAVITDIAKRLNEVLGTGGVGSDGDAARPLDTQAPDQNV